MPPNYQGKCHRAAIQNMVRANRIRVVFPGPDDGFGAGAQPIRV